MCFLISWLFQCGHTEEDYSDLCQTFVNTSGLHCDALEEQAVVMGHKCIPCRMADFRAEEAEYQRTRGEGCEEGDVEQAWDV